MDFPKTTFKLFNHFKNFATESGADTAKQLFGKACIVTDEALKSLDSQLNGLARAEAHFRLRQYGFNEIAREKRKSLWMRFFNNVKNPLVILLLILAIVSFVTGDQRATVVILIMVILSVVLRFYQEVRADNAAMKLRAMVRNTATVVREGIEQEIPLKLLVPGDIIHLAAGDMVPADVRILSAKDLFLNQAALTGESIPVEKHAAIAPEGLLNPLELPNICFLGSNVVSGSAVALVIHTSNKTYFGSLAANIVGERALTSFDKGVNRFTWLMIRFIAIMVPLVFLINGFGKHNWLEAFLFAMAVAVGLTPEMLPMIVTVNLSKGALMMARKRMIVKRLNAIQNFGAMDVLCTDKTGTITQGKIVLERYLDVHGERSDKVLNYAYLNSFYQTGLKNLMDGAILEHNELTSHLEVTKYHKIDEIPFDFIRKRMSVVIKDADTNISILICKGAVEEIMAKCGHVEKNDIQTAITLPDQTASYNIANELNSEGFRVIALAYKMLSHAPDKHVYEVKDESDLVLLGFLAFLDPPKDTALETLQRLRALNIDVKILTGDNEVVTAYICKKVGIPSENLLVGSQIEAMNEMECAAAVNQTSVFAKLLPAHKERIIHALQSTGHVIGFLGDGINDAPALKAADVGISVDSAVDIAKESSDMIMLKHSLLILEQGVIEGRRVFGNIIKYIKMAASSNFGNMFSVLGASIFLPFLPMLPIQILTNNLLYDFSQTTIPTDNVDADWLVKPRKWEISSIGRFILFIGPISSIFDYATFFIMLYVFNCWHNPALFQTGWFIESIFTQTLIIHVIRTNKIPFIESHASWPLTLASILVVAAAAWLVISPLGGALGFVPLPSLFWLFLAGILVCYVVLTQVVKVRIMAWSERAIK